MAWYGPANDWEPNDWGRGMARDVATISYGEEFFADPHPTYARLRELAPAVPVRDPNGLEYWLVTRYHEALLALSDPGLSKDPRHAWAALHDAGMVRGAAADACLSMLTADPPEHSRLRAPASRAFAPRAMERLRPRIQQVTDQLLDRVAELGHADLIDAFAFPLSVTILCELLGVPQDDRDVFRTWTTAAHTPTYVTDAPMSREEGARRLRSYVADLVARRQGQAGAQPQESSATAQPQDVIGTLVADIDTAGGLTETEVVETVSHLLLAGQDATTNLIGNGVAALLRHPDQLALLRQRPELLGPAVEELLRYDGPTARSSPRTATHDLDLGSVTIRAQDIVIVGLSAANQDPARFADPDRLDITRTHGQHLAFGHGIHFCVAAPLTRMTGQIAIGTLVRRFPHLTLARPYDELRWRPTPVFRGLVSLPVSVGPVNADVHELRKAR
jgi:cytochrome P450